MKGTLKRNLAFLLSVILVLTAIDHYHFSAKADVPSITQNGITYTYDDYTSMYIASVSGNGDVSGNVEVPDECILIIEGSFSCPQITVKAGGELQILGNGSFEGNLIGEPTAHLYVESRDHIPEGTNVYGLFIEEEDRFDDWNLDAGGYFIYEEGAGWIIVDTSFFWVWAEGLPSNEDFGLKYRLFESDPFQDAVLYDTFGFDDTRCKIYYINDPDWVMPQITVQTYMTNPNRVVLFGGIGWGEPDAEDPSDRYLIPQNPSDADSRSGNLTYTYFGDELNNMDLHHILMTPGYNRQGHKDIMDIVDDYIYAYDTDIMDRFTQELYERFIQVAMYEYFDIYSYEDMAGRITADPTVHTIDVIDKNGQTSTRTYQNYTIRWGVDQDDGSIVTNVVPVYTLTNPREFLVCTDFDFSNGTGTTFYSRICGDGEVPFSDDPQTDSSACLIVSADYEGVMAGGNGAQMDILNDEGLVSFEIASRYLDLGEYNWGTKCRVINPEEKYVVIGGSGETKAYGGLGLNGFRTDNVWATGEDCESLVYIGESTLYIEPLGSNLGEVETRSITSVIVDDPEMAAGVTVNLDNRNKITLEFASNFYDTVPILITYSDGSTQSLTICRVGLVIQYSYIEDQGPGIQTSTIYSDVRPGEQCDFTYDYWGTAGEQIVVWATYYHPSNDATNSGGQDLWLSLEFENGTRRIVHHTDSARGFDGYIEASDTAVATTSFIIGFEHSKILDQFGAWVDNVEVTDYHEGGFYATVLNAGFDDTSTYGGTQAGSGKGVYWDGHISWF